VDTTFVDIAMHQCTCWEKIVMK